MSRFLALGRVRFGMVVLFCLCLLGAVAGSGTAIAQRGVIKGPVPLGDSGLRIVLPENMSFQISPSINGFYDPDTGATVIGEITAEPYAEVLAKLQGEALQEAGVQVTNERETKFGRWSGQMMQIRQSENDIAYVKWISIFGDRSFTATVMTSFPALAERRHGETLRRMTRMVGGLNNYLSGDPAMVPYEVTPVPPLELMSETSNEKVFGVRPPAGAATNAQGIVVHPDRPELRITAEGYKNGGKPEDLQAYAEELMKTLPGLNPATIKASEESVIDGLPTVQIIGEAREKQGGALRRVYLAVLFQSHGVFKHTGAVNDGETDIWLARFIRTSQSFKRIRPTIDFNAQADDGPVQ